MDKIWVSSKGKGVGRSHNFGSKGSVENLRKALAERDDVTQDPLSAAKLFADRNQQRQEKVVDYAES